MEDRLYQNAIEISRRDEIIAKNQAVERRDSIRDRHRPSAEAVAARPGLAKALNLPENDLMVLALSRINTDPEMVNWPGPATNDALPKP
eukprot:3639393-Amphidinium_carterae.1